MSNPAWRRNMVPRGHRKAWFMDKSHRQLLWRYAIAAVLTFAFNSGSDKGYARSHRWIGRAKEGPVVTVTPLYRIIMLGRQVV